MAEIKRNSTHALSKGQRLARWATTASIATALLLVGVKLLAWVLTDSVALLSSLVDSLLDAMASLVAFMAVRHAQRPADDDHRFGHGKIEPLAALLQAGLICGSAIFLFAEGIGRLVKPVSVDASELGIAVIVLSIVVTFALTRFQAYALKHSGSVSVHADALHYIGDLGMNIAVIVALVVGGQLGITYADPLIAMGIAVWLLKSAWTVGRSAFDMLMDRELPDAERQQIEELVLAHSNVLGFHDLRTRWVGDQKFIQLHLELDGGLSLLDAHEIADSVELELMKVFPGSEVLVHQDPFGYLETRDMRTSVLPG